MAGPDRLQLAALALLALVLAGALFINGRTLRDDLTHGVRRWHAVTPPPPPPTTFQDPLAGILARVPARVAPVALGAGLLLKHDEDAMKGALVAPLVADRSVPATGILSSVVRAWFLGYREAGEAPRLKPMSDEGGRASARIDTGSGPDAVSGEVALVRAPPGYRFEAIWSPSEDFEKDRARLLELVRGVRLGPGLPVRFERAGAHAIAVPPGFALAQRASGLELTAREDPRVRLVFLAGPIDGATVPERLAQRVVATALEAVGPTTGAVRSYPLIKRGDQAWDVAVHDLEYSVRGARVRAVVTAALTAGRAGEAQLVSVRQAPADAWTRTRFSLALAESSARFTPPGGEPLALPIAHAEGTWMLVEAWEMGRALRRDQDVWREALLPLEIRGGWALPVWLAQPDGTYLDPDDPSRTLEK